MKDEEILVTVFCATYNHGDLLKSALDGFISQRTNFKYEVLVHDDASTDRTAELLEEYSSKYPDVIIPIIQEENKYSQNISILNTYGLPLARGKYFAFCEGDDYWCDELKLQKQIDFLLQHQEYVACVHQTKQINCKNGNECWMSPYSENQDVKIKDVIKGGNSVFQLSSIVCLKQLLEERPEFIYGSYMISLYLCLEGKVRYLNDCMSVYRLFACPTSWNSVNKNGDLEHWSCIIEKNNDRLKKVNEKYDFKYNDIFSEQIRKNEYEILVLRKSRRVFIDKRYRRYFKQESIKFKLKFIIKCCYYKLYKNIKDKSSVMK